MKQIFFILTTVLCIGFLQAQEDTDTIKGIKYDLSFDFNEGIFLSFSDFRNNIAIDFSKTNIALANQTPKESLIEKGGFEYFDEYGNRKSVGLQNIWGYAYKGKIYIFHANGFHLIPYIGTISHFIAQVLVRQNSINDPFYDPYYYYTGPSSYTRIENIQLLLDMREGKIYGFNRENVAYAIQSDSVLHKEYTELRKRKQRKLMFYYIRQFNEKHPIYFPEN